jgi:mannose-6-phosphate isomerase-like protein (cupin superfamily)
MIDMPSGIMRARDGMKGISWNILGQTYVPKQLSEGSFSWHATLPPGTFVPPHIHPKQDEFLYILEGKFDFLLDGQEHYGEPGDLVHMPKGVPHAIFNNSDVTIKTLFWVSPAQRLFDLFWAIHNMGADPDPAKLVALSAEHEVDFLPPPDA